MEGRKHPRMGIANIEADISDGSGFFTGVVQDISRFGLAIKDISNRLDKSADIYSVILDGPGTHFKLLVRPVWETDDGINRIIGAQIENSPWNWTEFVMRQEAQIDEFASQTNH